MKQTFQAFGPMASARLTHRRLAGRSLLAAATALCLASMGAHAAIAPGLNATGAQAFYSGNPELFFTVADPVAKVSYTLDLGITLNEFFVSGQPDAGTQRFWALTDAQWSNFTGLVERGNLVWAVTAFENFGATSVPGGARWFVTARQGDEAKIATTTNQNFSNITGARALLFLNAVNASGTHNAQGSANFTVNGSSVNAETDPGSGYFGEDALKPVPLNSVFGIANKIGDSSWFYYLTRSGADQLGTVVVDEFDNLGHDGYWGFTYVDPSLDSPYAGQYLLSYTLQGATLTQAQREFAAGIGRTEFNGAFYVQRLAGAAAAAQEGAAGFNARRLPGVALDGPMAPVPEPGTTALLLAGLAALAGLRHRRA